MTTLKRLKQTEPQKYYLKYICTVIYCLGGGNCWYTDKKASKPVKIVYTVWAVTVNVYALIVFLDEIAAVLRPLTPKERNDHTQFMIAHLTVSAKFVVLYLQRNRIKAFLERFLEDDREYVSFELEKASGKRALMYCIPIQITLFITLSSTMVDGIRTHFKEGIPIRAEVVYFPSPSQTGVVCNIFRFFIEVHWYYVVALMTSIDCLSVSCMVFLSSKFKLLSTYFEGLKKKHQANVGNKSQQELVDEFRQDFVMGIKLHQHALWYAKHVQYALGNLYSIQVVQSMFLLIICLIKLVANEYNLTFWVANFTYMSCLVALLGGYMMAGGDITYEASRVPTAIFNCGWELMQGDKELRTLAVVELIRSQRSVVMTAFGILELSYSNLIMVSFFLFFYSCELTLHLAWTSY
ncbi:uncharacterized protein LOC126370827 [Pectinophora gossypiella]|uniref:uncharacterized protein LOC126370827 n=1 Tax=Pectinophora gossypiella TaxID=13191 RepID=UPI00214ED174|nr:uncharacterized protein LOC126370827 [Pectinophora gossypiella]